MEKKSSCLRSFFVGGLIFIFIFGLIAAWFAGTVMRPVLRPADEVNFENEDAYLARTADGPGRSWFLITKKMVEDDNIHVLSDAEALEKAVEALEEPGEKYTLRNAVSDWPPSVGKVTSSTLYLLWRYKLMDLSYTMDPVYQKLLGKESAINPAAAFDDQGMRILIKEGQYLYSDQNDQSKTYSTPKSRIKPLAMSAARIGEAHIEAAKKAAGEKTTELYRPEHYSIPTPAEFKAFDDTVEIKPIIDGLDERLKNSPLNPETLSDLIILFEIEDMDDAYAKVVDADLFDAVNYLPLATDAFNLAPLGEGRFLIKHHINMFYPAPMRWVVEVAYGRPESMDMPLKEGAELVFDDGTSFTLPCNPVRTGERKPWQVDGDEDHTDDGIHGVHVLQIADMEPSLETPFFQAQFLDANHNPVGEAQSMLYPRSILTCREAEPRAEYLRITRYKGLHQYIVDLGELPGTPPANDRLEDLLRVKIPYPYAHIFSANTLLNGITDVNTFTFSSGLSRPWPPENQTRTTLLDILIRWGESEYDGPVDYYMEMDTFWIEERRSIPEKLEAWYEEFKTRHAWTFLP